MHTTTSRSARRLSALIAVVASLMAGLPSAATAQTFVAERLDGSSSSGGSDPLVSSSTFSSVGASGGSNINGPSVIRIPDWIPTAERAHEDANYYMYFGNHGGDDIRLAWSGSITGPWSLFNGEDGTSPNRAWGSNGDHSGTRTPGNGVFDLELGNGTLEPFNNSSVAVTGHVASPDVLVDDANRRIVMYFHGVQVDPVPGFDSNQKTFVATSKYGLNFNPAFRQGEDGQGMREVVLGKHYFRSFEVGGQTFAYSNSAELYEAPPSNDASRTNSFSNADSEGGWWRPSTGSDAKTPWWTQRAESDNPLQQLYRSLGEGTDDPRHFAVYTRAHIDSGDTNIYVFYSAKDDAPESILLTVIDTSNGSTNPGNWSALGQEIVLAPELDWEGGNFPNARSEGGRGTGVRQLRDPFVFEDDNGTSGTEDDELYLFYSGAGEEAIGVARLSPVMHIIKRNASDFAIDGNRGAADFQDVYLWGEDQDNVNQQWIEISRGGGFFSYQKMGTNHCIDGNNGGDFGQEVYIYTCSEGNRNQHWKKIPAGGGAFRLQKRNSSGFSIDGMNGGGNGQLLILWGSNANNGNQQWRMNVISQ